MTVQFADDTTVVGLISGGEETMYREEVQRLFCNSHISAEQHTSTYYLRHILSISCASVISCVIVVSFQCAICVSAIQTFFVHYSPSCHHSPVVASCNSIFTYARLSVGMNVFVSVCVTVEH